jgi:hypothetical protein
MELKSDEMAATETSSSLQAEQTEPNRNRLDFGIPLAPF